MLYSSCGKPFWCSTSFFLIKCLVDSTKLMVTLSLSITAKPWLYGLASYMCHSVEGAVKVLILNSHPTIFTLKGIIGKLYLLPFRMSVDEPFFRISYSSFLRCAESLIASCSSFFDGRRMLEFHGNLTSGFLVLGNGRMLNATLHRNVKCSLTVIMEITITPASPTNGIPFDFQGSTTTFQLENWYWFANFWWIIIITSNLVTKYNKNLNCLVSYS